MRNPDAKFAKYLREVHETPPETPQREWVCPCCRVVRPGNVSYCDHPVRMIEESDLELEQPRLDLVEEVFSSDMRPRLRWR